jgi:butyryl-CoA dehydrogenase
MDLQLTEKQEMTRKMAKELATKEIAPIAAEIDETRKFPKEVIKKMADAGLYGIIIPPPFGGAGGEKLEYLLALEEIAAASASVAWSFAVSVDIALIILAFGSDAQRKKYLPAMAKGEKLGGLANTEPSGGANWFMTLQTKAVADGDHYVVNGSKCFATNAEEADIYIVSVRTDPTKGPMGISTLIIEKDTPGFSFGKMEDKFGLRGDPTGELIFEDCRVPKANLLGQEGDGMKILQAAGAIDCAGQPAIAAGIARAALEASIKYVKERTVAGPKTVADFDTVQCTIADMAAAVEAAKLLAYRGAFPAVKEGPDPLIFMGAILSEQLALDVTGKAVELHGGYGCTKDFPVGRYFRDAKTLSLVPPTTDFIRAAAGKMILGMPMMGPPPGAGGPPGPGSAPGPGGPPHGGPPPEAGGPPK